MKIIYTLFLFLFVAYFANGQERFLTKTGTISFFSKSPLENIEAENSQVLSIVDAGNGQMAIAILMQSFLFQKALMQEHFNENYVESDIYPKATFKGNIIDFDKISATETPVKIIGEITIHGESQKITIEAIAKKTQVAVFMTGDFYINLADFAVDIPSIVRNKIAQKIKVSFRFNHKPYK